MERRYSSCKNFYLMIIWIIAAGCALPVQVSGLRPEYPEARTKNLFETESPAFDEVDSLQPIFRWEPFPRSQDQASELEGFATQVSEVTYELKIWREKNNLPTEMIYSRIGLNKPFHKIELSLEPSTKYFWTIRAGFKLNGQPRVTEWGTYRMGRRSDRIPNPFYFRFKTPSK